MYGAIIGDLAGSIYEYGQIKKVSKINVKELILPSSFYSDDTILTMAILDAINNDCNYEFYLKKYGKYYLNYRPDVKEYFEKLFSSGFIKWLNSGVGASSGNGAMMRISPVGYMFNTIEEVNKNSLLATIPSHNTSEAIRCANIVASIIFYARKGYKKEEIIKKLNINLNYVPFKNFNYTCTDTIDNCLYALFTSNSFEESIKTVISYGGDTDTNACIVGSMAEAMYGISNELINKTNEKIPVEFVKILKQSYNKIRG